MYIYNPYKIYFLMRSKEHKIQTIELEWSRTKNELRKATSKNFGMVPTGRKRKLRPRNSWMQEVTIGMRGKGIKNMEWIDREQWRRIIKL